MSESKNHIVAETIARRLFDRLMLIRLAPTCVMQLGAAELVPALTERYQLTPINLTAPADLTDYDTASADLLLVNLLQYQFDDLGLFFVEANRVLRPEGLLLFSTFGPDTFTELRQSYAACTEQVPMKNFFDMHDLGDALLTAGFADPVMDMETLNLQFSTFARLHDYAVFAELVEPVTAPDALSGHYEAFKTAVPWPAHLELVYGHAWRPQPKQQTDKQTTQEVMIPIEQIGRRQ